jgi:predicted acetyltransferase
MSIPKQNPIPDLPITITPLQEEDLESFYRLQQEAFHVTKSFMQELVKNRGQESFVVVRVRDEATIAAAAGVLPMAQWFGGVAVPTTGISSVSVALPYRGSGVGLAMMRRLLQRMHADGVPLSTLYPASYPFYGRVGYGVAGHHIGYELALAAIPREKQEPSLDVCQLTADITEYLQGPYTHRAQVSNGHLDRPAWVWQQYLQPDDPEQKTHFAYLIQREGQPEGYAILNHERTTHAHLRAVDLCVLTPAAALCILNLLAGASTMVEHAEWTAGINDLFVCMAREKLMGTIHQAVRVKDMLEWMLRIVCVDRALQLRGYPVGLQAELHLDIRDDVLPANNGRIVLHIADGKAEVQAGGTGRIRLDIRHLASLYSGFFAPTDLVARGLLEAPEEDLALLTAAFAGPRPWMPDMF